jgi:hypothetical protein
MSPVFKTHKQMITIIFGNSIRYTDNAFKIILMEVYLSLCTAADISWTATSSILSADADKLWYKHSMSVIVKPLPLHTSRQQYDVCRDNN